ncbi:head maturation protease, ClpP-related [Burkholderia multivorans]|uniref:head maturation protease, ClpP-related n=1 Tax=Burkholderia multivorans TaxID=87883 RepID=UPI0006A5CCB3|nr:head maturation protease, ClpP-related [Burkholderia multivorans]KOE26826.1 peptidase S14 [Burkholderia multivorans R-20526]MBR8046578.1 Clp protease ClpP [Burkholderia multivorans]MBU9662182.1 Clp protease ClpP [Burkholderia multivorans]MDR8877229.1 ATP-dependent Clp protease proteolytic subunit [Burkholderia multivorans]MDR8883828.1 ATP-dependent Clp protease proteolytic subunit [Burkholderia multivorans]
MKGKKRWWDIRAQANAAGEQVAEIRIYGDIGFWGTDAELFATRLDEVAATATSIVVAVNSMGGDVFDAFTIYNALRRHAGKVTGRVDGVAASAASLILMACDEIVMPSNAMLMIHNPHTVAAGEASDLRKLADLLDSTSDNMLAAYVERSGRAEDEVRAIMDAETWLTAAQAQEQGFCDTIVEPIRIAAYAGAARHVARFSAVPDPIRALLADDAEAPPAPTPQPAPSAGPDVAALASHVYAACRDARIEHCAEGIVLATGLRDRATVDAAIRNAQDIAGICLAANLTELTAGFVADGLTPDQVRARLFERVTASHTRINHRAQPVTANEPTMVANAPRAASIYAARKSRK